MNSMTGFGRGTASDERVEITIELNSVNKRNLETSLSLPKDWASLERPLVEKIRDRFARGRVQGWVQFQLAPGVEAFSWDKEQAAATLAQLKRFAQEQVIHFEANAELLFKIALQHRASSDMLAADEIQPLVEEAMEVALDLLSDMRAKEGAALEKDLRVRCDALNELRNDIAERAEGVVPAYRDALFARLKQLGPEIDCDDERVLKEIALFADRSDVTEELTRLDSHLDQYADFLDEEGPIGRKFEFLLQEINREFNTIGSKANEIEISKRVIAAKNEIERIREQIQNVE